MTENCSHIHTNHTFTHAANLVIADVKSRCPDWTDEECLDHVYRTVNPDEIKPMAIPHIAVPVEDAVRVARHNELAAAYRLVLDRYQQPSHAELLDCLAKISLEDCSKLNIVQRVWALRARRGNLPEALPTRTQLIELVRKLSSESVVELSPHQVRWIDQAQLFKLR